MAPLGMNDEAFRMLTNTMADIGFAMGGQGSVGDMIGKGVRMKNASDENEANYRKRIADRLKADQVSGQNYLDALKGLTPPHEAGPTKVEVNKDGTKSMTFTPDDVAQQMALENTATASGSNKTNAQAPKQIGPGTINAQQVSLMPQETYGLSAKDLQSAITQANAISTAGSKQTYQQLLNEQISQSIAQNSAMNPGKQTLQQQQIAEGEKKAMMSQIIELLGGAKTTAGKLGDYQLGETASTTQVKNARAALNNPEIGAKMLEQRRAGAMNLGEVLNRDEAKATQKLQASFKDPKYMQGVRKSVAENNKELARAAMRSGDSYAKQRKQFSEKINNQVHTDLSTAYGGGIKKGYVKSSDQWWFVHEDEQGNLIPILPMVK